MIPKRNLKRFFLKTLRQPAYGFSVLRRRSKANLYYKFGKGRSSYPEAITLFLTHRCNLRCKMCGQWGKEGITARQSAQYIQAGLTLNELQSIIDDISSFKPNITLFGGEPLLYHDCIKIIRYIKQKGMHCLMITNGSLLEDVAKDIVDTDLDELNVSLDGGGRLHDQIRGMDGLFDKIMRGLKEVSFFKTQSKKKGPLINLECTITKYNYRFLDELLEVANETRVDSLTFHNLIFIDRKLLDKQKVYDNLLGCSSIDWEGFIFEPEIEPELLYEKIEKISSNRYPFSVDFYPNFSHKALLEYYKSPNYMPSDYHCLCLSPWLVAYIFPDGEVRPCLDLSYSFGNLREYRFAKIWNSEQAITFRKVLKKAKTFPVCVRCTEFYRY